MTNSVRTAWSIQAHAAMENQLAWSPLQYTTLNEKFGVQTTAVVAAGVYPKTRYLAIGNGGHYASATVDGIAGFGYYKHKTIDAALFRHLPFIARPINSDLTAAEAENYAMRVVTTIDSAQYVLYYLKRLSVSGSDVLVQYRTTNSSGVETTTVFQPTTALLEPARMLPSSTEATEILGDMILVSSVIDTSLSSTEIEEIKNACILLYGNLSTAIISETALVGGVDKVVSVTRNGVASTQLEVVKAQCMAFFQGNYVLAFTTSINKPIDLGNSEPVLAFTTAS